MGNATRRGKPGNGRAARAPGRRFRALGGILAGLLLALSLPSRAAPPYAGTIFVDPDILTAADPTTFVRLDDAGRGSRLVFDRRENAFITINAFLFTAVYSDGLRAEVQVNPEFGNAAAARAEAATYAPVIGRLPRYLRLDAQTVTIHAGTQPFGGGNNNLLIHTGQAASYVADGILEETLFHEASHTSLDSRHATAAGWLAAQKADGEFISTYARDNPTREDVAETALLHYAVRKKADRISAETADLITATIPARLAYLDARRLDLFAAPGPPTVKLDRIAPVPRTSTKVLLRGTGSANLDTLSVPGAKVTRSGTRFTVTVPFPVTKTRLTVRLVAVATDGRRTTQNVVLQRR